jgi:hypothetical protein
MERLNNFIRRRTGSSEKSDDMERLNNFIRRRTGSSEIQ